MGAAIPRTATLADAVNVGLEYIPADCRCATAVELARSNLDNPQGDVLIREQYEDLSVVHTVNNLAVVVWSLLRNPEDYSAAIGEAVEAGLDTDCNAATVGGLWGLQGKPIPEHWLTPWLPRVGVSLAGQSVVDCAALAQRTLAVAQQLAADF